MEALLYEVTEKDAVRCNLCHHRCLIREGTTGTCRVRRNEKGTLVSLVYGKVIASHADPIEKKPLYHFFPGTASHSIATVGCNFRCTWCQNWEISQMPADRGIITGEDQAPLQVVERAKASGSRTIAYTYTEPTVFFEYALDTAKLAHENGLKNVFVTNGYMTEQALDIIGPYLDAANVDLKAFRDEAYRKYSGARLQPVLDNLKLMKSKGIWVEITTLLVPGINDDPHELEELVGFMVTDLGPETPWHISRYHPSYRMGSGSSTPPSIIDTAAAIGLDGGIRYVYLGNVAGETNTYCHECGELLIRRQGFWVLQNRVSPDAACPSCGADVAGVGMTGS
jgi:pyruvate formate lyase activating enzyme